MRWSLFHSEVLDDEVYDMADLTLGCGRKGDSLKLALGWIYYGKEGYESNSDHSSLPIGEIGGLTDASLGKINHAFDVAAYFSQVLSRSRNFDLVSSNPPPCLQV